MFFNAGILPVSTVEFKEVVKNLFTGSVSHPKLDSFVCCFFAERPFFVLTVLKPYS